MELFPDEVISEFKEFKNANSNNFSWWNYVNMKSDLQTALAFAKFYYPDIVEVQGYFLLKDKYQKDLLQKWIVECDGDKITVEKMMNLYELKDFFHINVNKDENEPEQVVILGKILKLFWTMSFKHRFPDKNITVEIYEEWDSLFITVYQEN
ncbi:hypothetical protein WJ0W_002069 [Paenibacillus melissococcoides]|uniref:Uncharacterized protein n=1 Tax=Paenibacillus melissococcoides TaxID=2912268 RepID=A0ABM9FZT2_9BACL|nr:MULTISPECIES: hypothetical protein [Paenibacillus]MEB9892602.1 hypothetical protein [Bacillus cereus]CAH8244838.1 hypothetical protein WJ0W_002069 [Paenibacillus melissococcoides]CAH8709126.1 hypothetical protein WDD9_002151 [Paenibacillus melissococcoides]CAH8709882.1 hypothetical protein HTL2_002439 [Paenibacillus melissococcoides]GIO82399.1 hypothetical protein J6TS7_60090 [Paenibacillus dendritiformis]